MKMLSKRMIVMPAATMKQFKTQILYLVKRMFTRARCGESCRRHERRRRSSWSITNRRRPQWLRRCYFGDQRLTLFSSVMALTGGYVRDLNNFFFMCSLSLDSLLSDVGWADLDGQIRPGCDPNILILHWI
uniref:Uncharacterized protein n=1 Tax=Triticum urartu TaxID=4572 RepID=A0A8R7U5R3_TRIUA